MVILFGMKVMSRGGGVQICGGQWEGSGVPLAFYFAVFSFISSLKAAPCHLVFYDRKQEYGVVVPRERKC